MKALRKFSVVPILVALTHCAQVPTKPDGRIVSNPYEVVWQRFDGNEKGTVRFFLDINQDRKRDLFVGARSYQDSSGGRFQVFLWTHKGYRFLGTIPQLNPYLVEVLPTKPTVMASIKTLWPIDSQSARIFIYRHDGEDFVRDLNKSYEGQFADGLTASPTKLQFSRTGFR